MRHSLAAVAAILICLFFASSTSNRVWYSGTIEDPLLDEISGLVASHTIAGLYWGINDSANAAILFALDKKGAGIGKVAINGGPYRDIEALGYGDCEYARKCIFIADIGDNGRERRRVRILIIKEPDPKSAYAPILQTIFIEYPNGPRNAEALIIRPTDGEIFIIEKLGRKSRHKNPIIYRIPRPDPKLKEANVIAEPIAQIANKAKNGIDLGSITDASFLANGKGFFIRDYSNVFYSNDLIQSGAIINLQTTLSPFMRQSEAIAVSKNQTELVITSEGRHSGIIAMNIEALIKRQKPKQTGER